MRKLLIGILVLVVVLVGGAYLAVTNINSLLDENRERLAGLASDAAGRKIDFEDAEVAFSSGLAVRVAGLKVGEDPKFGKASFLELDSAFVELEIWPALQRRFEVKAVRLESPTIRVIETSAGFNFESLGDTGAAGTENAQGDSGGDAPGDSPPLALAIAALEIENGTLIYEDRKSRDGLALTIESLDTSGTDLTLDGPAEIEFSGRLRPSRGDTQAVSAFAGVAKVPDLSAGAATIALSSPSFFPRTVGLVFEEGDARERLDDVTLNIDLPADSTRSGMPIVLHADAARLSGYDMTDVDAKLNYRGDKLKVEDLTMGMVGGRVSVSGDLDFGKPNALPFDLDTRVDGLDSGQLATLLFDLPVGFMTGRLSGEVNLAGESFDWDVLQRTLAGAVKLDLAEGALEQVNVLDNLVGRLVADPGIGALTANSLREIVPASLQGNRTPFQNANVMLEIADGALRANAIDLKAGDFMLVGSGLLGLDGSVDGDGQIRFSEELSEKILKKADRFAPLLAAGGKIVELPLTMKGDFSSPNLRPNLAALTAQAQGVATRELGNRAASELTNLLFGGRNKNKRKDAEKAAAAAAAGGEGASASGLAGDVAAGGSVEEAAEGALDGNEDPRDAKEIVRDDAEKLIEKGLGKLFGN
ncbi:MAG: AsmA family protein [Myxococcota bacterium]